MLFVYYNLLEVKRFNKLFISDFAEKCAREGSYFRLTMCQSADQTKIQCVSQLQH